LVVVDGGDLVGVASLETEEGFLLVYLVLAILFYDWKMGRPGSEMVACLAKAVNWREKQQKLLFQDCNRLKSPLEQVWRVENWLSAAFGKRKFWMSC